MKHLLVVCLLLGMISAGTAHAQNWKKYDKLSSEASALYDLGKYLESGQKYSAAFASTGNKGTIDDRYNAACSWALAGQTDSAFYQLMRATRKGDYTDYHHLTTDTDLKSLYGDPRWEEIKANVKAAKEQAEAKFDKPLVALLDSIFTKDQQGRLQIDSVRKKFGEDSPELTAHFRSIYVADSLNLIAVTHILDTRGWLGPEVVGGRGNTTLFLVIQHAEIATQEKYLPMMREAVKEKRAEASSLALLEDRVALRQGKRQTYGSQIGRDPATNTFYVLPLEDPENVDKRRAEVGLPPLADYVSNWGLKWNPKKYLKDLPRIEALQKKP